MGILDKHLKEYEEYMDREFQKTMESLKPTFEKNGWHAPRDFKEIADWYYFLELKEYPPKIADRKVYIQWAEATQPKETSPMENSEKLENLPHKLCLLDDLGILDLIEKRFSDKYYKGTSRETDKARLIATLFEMKKPENVRQALKNKDYLSKKAKDRAVQTLQNHGLEPEKFTD